MGHRDGEGKGGDFQARLTGMTGLRTVQAWNTSAAVLAEHPRALAPRQDAADQRAPSLRLRVLPRAHSNRTVADPDGLFEVWANNRSLVEP